MDPENADILTKLDELIAISKEILKRLPAPKAKSKPQVVQAEPSSASELDSQYGDPEVKKDPPIWLKQGKESYVGKKFSECPSDYLDALASFFEWKASKNEADAENGTGRQDADTLLKYAGYAMRDAARARGWSKRVRAKETEVSQTDIPF